MKLYFKFKLILSDIKSDLTSFILGILSETLEIEFPA